MKDYFLHCIKENKLAHAYLFAGSKNSDSLGIANWLADQILDLSKQKIHPDFIQITKEEGKHALSVQRMRESMQKIYRAPSLADKKVVMIEDAHEMSISASNAFLKTLEEPPKSTVILMLSEKPHLLPQTIISRCQVVTFTRSKDSFSETDENFQFAKMFLKNSKADRLLLLENEFKSKKQHADQKQVWQTRLNIMKQMIHGILIQKLDTPDKFIKVIDMIDDIQVNLYRNINIRLALESLAINL